MKGIIVFFDRLEDKVRNFLSRFPIFYALVGGIGVVLFWRGVWHTADFFTYYFLAWVVEGKTAVEPIMAYDGPISMVIGIIMLLMTGLWVSNFIGSEVMISGLRREKKIAEKSEKEIRTEAEGIAEIKKELENIENKLDRAIIKK
ncbi:hypothetical protein HYT01_03255 [Candidatus Giovannonibacteria bacterium]|nr:hypothetical protein [Candidatus Giovannonibacteria bacterium]